ncbi:HET-domain-containing protein [Acephala macrosclerotiorum]|nr:HET-domain-containing protein [Acephala macrosclerotiorum]
MEGEAPLYTPLDPTRREIRLLRILPPTDEAGTIHCQLETVSLDDEPEYNALSYEWNPPGCGASSTKVVVNDHEVPATANLRHALERLEAGPRYWIDALSINQSDDEERGHQVQVMRDIFEHAHQVIVWLGLGNNVISGAMDLIAELARHDLFWDKSNLLDCQKWLIEKLSNPVWKPHWEGIIQIYKNSYWNRLWIVQEIVVARQHHEVPVLCNTKRIAVKELGQIEYHMNKLARIKSIDVSSRTLAYDIYRAGREVLWLNSHARKWDPRSNRRSELTLLVNLARYYEQQCLDPRDKVYALLGISAPIPGFTISYNVPASEVFRNAAMSIIQGSHRLDILLDCHRFAHEEPSTPSWVPNWVAYARKRRTLYKVVKAWEASGSLSCKASFLNHENILRTRGFIVGKIASICSRFSRSSKRRVAKSFRTWFDFTWSTLEHFRDLEDPEDPKETNKLLLKATMKSIYDVMVRTRFDSDYQETWAPMDNFRSHCEKLASYPEMLREDSQPFVDHYNFEKNLAGLRLCAITLSASSPSPTSDDEELAAEDPESSSPNTNIASKDFEQTVGYCRDYSEVGDVVAVIRGCRYPVHLRRVGHQFVVINSIYVYGFMRGEAVDRFEEVDIELV